MLLANDPMPNFRCMALALLDVVFPRNCVVTGEPADYAPWRYLSRAGVEALRRAQPSLCDTYGLPIYGGIGGGKMFTPTSDIGPVFQQGRTAVIAHGAARRMVHMLKYEQGVHLVADMARFMVETPGFREFLEGAVLVPVPLHPRKQQRRGYNQALLLARKIAQLVPSVTVSTALVRVKDTATQTRLDREAREANVHRAFSIAPVAVVQSNARHVVLDDVFTTGATLNACCAALQGAGIERIDIASFAHG